MGSNKTTTPTNFRARSKNYNNDEKSPKRERSK
jgi:hypothetical protein